MKTKNINKRRRFRFRGEKRRRMKTIGLLIRRADPGSRERKRRMNTKNIVKKRRFRFRREEKKKDEN